MSTIAAYALGLHTSRLGLGYNMNPYCPFDEVYKHEAWLDGWCIGAEEEMA